MNNTQNKTKQREKEINNRMISYPKISLFCRRFSIKN